MIKNKDHFDEYHYSNPNLMPRDESGEFIKPEISGYYYLEVITKLVEIYEPIELPPQASFEGRGYWQKNKTSNKRVTKVLLKRGESTVSIFDSVQIASFECCKLNKKLKESNNA